MAQSTKKIRLRRRVGNDPTRRIADSGRLESTQLEELISISKYVGSGHHKRNPADYEMPITNPRPDKSLCDEVRVIQRSEAQSLLEAGIRKGMISLPLQEGLPKYVWSVSTSGEVFEAKTHPNSKGEYHGYPLNGDDEMRQVVLKAWDKR